MHCFWQCTKCVTRINLRDGESNKTGNYRRCTATDPQRRCGDSVRSNSGSQHRLLGGTGASASVQHQLHTNRRGNGIMDR
jgi:hypothetical protein